MGLSFILLFVIIFLEFVVSLNLYFCMFCALMLTLVHWVAVNL